MADIKVEIIDHLGDDLRVVNAARCSFDKESDWIQRPYDPSQADGENPIFLDEELPKAYEPYEDYSALYDDKGRELGPFMLARRDENLIQFLARGCTSGEWDQAINKLLLEADDAQGAEAILKWSKSMPTHWTPFAHCQITLRETVPIFLARQRRTHMIGFVYNEVSRRYVTDEPEFYVPEVWRKASADKKQGSSDEEVRLNDYCGNWGGLGDDVEIVLDICRELYSSLLSKGVCAEQARMVLPQSMMTSYYVTGSLYAFANAYKARSRDDAQREWKPVVEAWDRIIRPLYPVSWSALVD